MTCTTKYVALDVHQATTVASVREERGRVIARTILPTEAPAIVEFFRGMRGAVHVALEEGTQAQWLHDLLFRARAIPTRGTQVYQPRERARWLAQLPERGARFRAQDAC